MFVWNIISYLVPVNAFNLVVMKYQIIFLFILFSLSGCTSDITKEVPPLNSNEEREIEFPQHWLKQAAFDEVTGLVLYRSSTLIGTKKTNMYALVFDPAKVEFKPVISTTAKKVSRFFADENGDVYAVANGGYFGVGISYSLVRWNGETMADNIRGLNRNYQGVPTAYYPTRAAFGLNTQNKPGIGWVYTVNQAGGPLYIYPQPSPNIEGSAPQAVPSPTFPSGGTIWDVKSAIGGSPVLVKGGIIKITDSEELISVDNTSSRARTAIGYLKNNFVVLFVAEGGNTSESIPGLTLQDVAMQMKDIGCVDAINLDGGGSSAMVVKNNHTIKPSDTAGERAVISALVVKKK